MTLQRQTPAWVFLRAVLATGLGIALVACGGGTGIGPGEIQKREDQLKDELPINWDAYNGSDYQGAIDDFTQTLEQADALEGIEQGVRNQVKAEAQSGIGWAFLRLQDLVAASQAFAIATQLDRTNADAWVGWAGVSLALRKYGDVIQFTNQALELRPEYNSGNRTDSAGRVLGHDVVDQRHVRIMLAEAYFQLGRYSSTESGGGTAPKPDPNNAAAQVKLVDRTFKYRDPGQLLERISELSLELQATISAG